MMQIFTIDRSQLPYRCLIEIAGRSCGVATNDRNLVDVLSDLRTAVEDQPGDFSMLIRVHEESGGEEEIPHFRGLHHLVFASFGPWNRFVFNLATRSISAAITGDMARNRAFWYERMLPIAIGVLGATMSVLPLHAACLSTQGDGLLIAGVSGTGKSTLSVALAKSGFEFVTDDWTYITCDRDRIVAHGLHVPVKLLPDATAHFPELRQHDLTVALNGELAYEVSPADALELRVTRRCNPRWLVFYERVDAKPPELVKVPAQEVHKYVESSIERLPLQLPQAAKRRDAITERLVELPCWRFQHSGSPQLAAQTLKAFFARQSVGVVA